MEKTKQNKSWVFGDYLWLVFFVWIFLTTWAFWGFFFVCLVFVIVVFVVYVGFLKKAW